MKKKEAKVKCECDLSDRWWYKGGSKYLKCGTHYRGETLVKK